LLVLVVKVIVAHSCTSSYGATTTTIFNCITCQSTMCTKCDDGYFLQKGWCPQCSANCARCTCAETCDSCNSGYIKFKQSMTEVICTQKDGRMNVAGCVMYMMSDNQVVCAECQSGTVLNPNLNMRFFMFFVDGRICFWCMSCRV